MFDQRKNEIRRQIRIRKNQTSLEDKKILSEIIFKKIEDLESFKRSTVILAYWSMNDEVFTHDFVQKWAEEKQFILPSVKGDKLELKRFSGISNLIEGESFGIGEPSGDVFDRPEKIDLIIVPGVAFDVNNNRLGRGKAYYDKLLKTTMAYKVGVCFDFQLIDSVPIDDHDVKMDLVISDT